MDNAIKRAISRGRKKRESEEEAKRQRKQAESRTFEKKTKGYMARARKWAKEELPKLIERAESYGKSETPIGGAYYGKDPDLEAKLRVAKSLGLHTRIEISQERDIADNLTDYHTYIVRWRGGDPDLDRLMRD